MLDFTGLNCATDIGVFDCSACGDLSSGRSDEFRDPRLVGGPQREPDDIAAVSTR